MQTVLISGASIAGPTLAYWLHRNGFAPTIVEQAPAPRTGGQAIDVRGVALEVVNRMGVLTDIQRARTQMRGMSMLDGHGNEIHRTEDMTVSGGRLDNDDVELLREDLTHLLHTLTHDNVEYIFDDAITSLDEDPQGVRATFQHGQPRTFDLVIGADGQHSNVRALTFGHEGQFHHHLGMHLGIFSTDNFLDLDNWQVWLRDGNAGYGIYPVRDNTELRVNIGFHSGPIDYDYRDIEQQKQIITDRVADLRWETPRLVKAMWDATDFYFDSMAQIRMDTWSRGRVTLVGDAGYCASALSGQGTSLALVGAYILADELAKTGGDHLAAYTRYEQRMRPFVDLNQALATENPGMPASEESIECAKTAISLGTP
ncbi:FAD-dependent monooxygenase [Actinocrispum wychmicini]|uniref:2-polyprenyl-6-methoxyphenol hydroxylase-like FAD-dependent oxidoreductase n=1 Tax=Actinocrispum wychmicini TaxID=1213861 RepID=A0A4R2JT13_9PSEU|nr:FAD-dependent monooxygenase [Actinocrispum wychmicini]TCO62092.1 2-polyprenyl-6-methoxyphenol hydroxylase-like FAD-dependent oxidoreductase [Actinocrispum wychmicini]